MKDELLLLIQEKKLTNDKKFKSQFLSEKPYKYSNKENLRYLFYLTELNNWLRDNYQIFIEVVYIATIDKFNCYINPNIKNVGIEKGYVYSIPCNKIYYDNASDALEAGILNVYKKLQ